MAVEKVKPDPLNLLVNTDAGRLRIQILYLAAPSAGAAFLIEYDTFARELKS